MHTLALIAHDRKKAHMAAWAAFNRDTLATFRLIATGNTARVLREQAGLEVDAVLEGPDVRPRVSEGTSLTASRG